MGRMLADIDGAELSLIMSQVAIDDASKDC